MKRFYNPIWMPSEEAIIIWSIEIPDTVIIKDVNQFQLYVRDYYKKLSKNAFQIHGDKIYKWYHEFIDDNYGYTDSDTLIDCLMESDKYYHQLSNLKKNIEQNIMPEDIIGSDEAEKISEGIEFYNLLYFFDNMFVF